MNGEIVYRPLTESDLKAVDELESLCFCDPWTKNMFLGAFLSEFFCGFGAFDGEKLVGFIVSTVVFEDAETDDVAVHPDYRRKGIGRELLLKAEEEAVKRGAARAFLEVRVGNGAAFALYEKCGYKTLRRRNKYYPDGEDAFVMTKRLVR